MAITKRGRKALARAMKERREELGLTQRRGAEVSKEKARSKGLPGSKPGIGEVKWGHLETCKPHNPKRNTLLAVDLALDWPEGTASAHLYETELPPPGPDGEVAHEQWDELRAEILRELADHRDDLRLQLLDVQEVRQGLQRLEIRLERLERHLGPEAA